MTSAESELDGEGGPGGEEGIQSEPPETALPRTQVQEEPEGDEAGVILEEEGQDQGGGEGARTIEKHDLSQQVPPPDLPSASFPTFYETGHWGCTRWPAVPLLRQTHPTLYSSPIKPLWHHQGSRQGGMLSEESGLCKRYNQGREDRNLGLDISFNQSALKTNATTAHQVGAALASALSTCRAI